MVSPFCFLKASEAQSDEGSLSVAQMKARRIIESFINPFRMVRDGWGWLYLRD